MRRMPQRTCIGCSTRKDKKELIRIVKNSKNIINIDKIGKLEGRGAYICNDLKCVEKAKRTRKLEKSFKIRISNDVYENIENFINGGEFIG